METFDDKDRLLKNLIADHDPAYADQWLGLGDDYQHKKMAGIVAFELKVLTLQCKIKLSPHRPETQTGIRAAYETGTENQRTLTQRMSRLSLAADSPENTPK